ncbi:MAG: DUF488 domain-containing protein [Synergistaceae bacterium]|jgi:uncharacterized protein (DUF488 family)|nr:DUF488 domain-containing protein [Synergistaceae bacterium]
MKVYTIGYEGTSLEIFLSCLRENKINFLADVREKPLSRKPGFSKNLLSERLCALGIQYKHFQKLGCPADIRKEYCQNGNWQQYCFRFKEHLEGNLETLETLVRYSEKFTSAFMCFEADPNKCHRLLIAQRIDVQYKTVIQNLHPVNSRQMVTIFAAPEPCFA